MERKVGLRGGAAEAGGGDGESAEKMELGGSEIPRCDRKILRFNRMRAGGENLGGKLLMKNRHKTDVKPT